MVKAQTGVIRMRTGLDYLNRVAYVDQLAETLQLQTQGSPGYLLAQRILDKRKELGKFRSVDLLMEVDGIELETHSKIVKLLEEKCPGTDPKSMAYRFGYSALSKIWDNIRSTQEQTPSYPLS